MKLTDRELWLMRQAFNDGVCDDNFDAWLNEGAADGVTVADVIAKNAPEDSAIAAAVADEREACALVCEQSSFPAFTARCFAADAGLAHVRELAATQIKERADRLTGEHAGLADAELREQAAKIRSGK